MRESHLFVNKRFIGAFPQTIGISLLKRVKKMKEKKFNKYSLSLLKIIIYIRKIN